MSAIDQAKKFVDFLTPEAPPEKFIFRRFPGDVLAKAAATKEKIDGSKIEKVVLKINPTNVAFTKRKVIQKVQTSAPDRFVVFDWGHELTTLAIAGVTGNLLPDSLTKGVLDPLGGAAMDILALAPDTKQSIQNNNVAKTLRDVSSNVNSLFNDFTFDNYTYSDLLALSPKYKTFKKLEHIYDESDADNDIITLEIGDIIYRGFFEDFNFTVSADSPWNWEYGITFVSLANLTEALQKNDKGVQDIESITDKS